jgi:citronellol/citronellal dehydrogenase
MTEPPIRYGYDDAQLAALPTVYAADLFAGRTMLVSGGGSGIGRATAWLLARLGARVVFTGRKAEKLADARRALKEAGLKAETFPVDIRNPESVAALYAHLKASDLLPDTIVNSAGGQFPQAALAMSDKGWQTVIATNLDGTWRMMQGAAKMWQEAPCGGNIINIVVVVRQGLYGIAHSVAARAGVIGLSQNLAVEWAQHGIRINCIAPGVIETAGWNVYDPAIVAGYPASNPAKRVGSAWDVAQTCAFLASSAADFTTGELIHVAGGGQLWGETWTIERPAHFG